MALIYRAHFAFSKTPRINSKGINTGATFGFTNTVLEVLKKEKPTHLAVAFDMHGPTFRHEQFAAYKAQRQEQPEDITLNIPYCLQMLEALNIKVLMKQGFEADDIIGTLAKQAEKSDFKVFMMTSDKDYCQLVTENVFVYKPAFMGKGPETLDIAKVLEKFEISNVDQVRDILGLQGDAVDNIPGIPGVGEKTARKLIADFGTVENLIANADKLTGKLKENVVQFASQGILSKELATIHTSVPIEVDLDSLIIKPPHTQLINSLCDELEFKALKARLMGETVIPVAKSSTSKTPSGQMSLFGNPELEVATESEVSVFDEEPIAIDETKELINLMQTPHYYHIVNNDSKLESLRDFLLMQKEVCFDTETTDLEAADAELVGLSFCWRKNEAYYVPCVDALQTKKIIEVLRPFFESDSIVKIGQNIKYDLIILKNYGIELKGKMFDTMLAHYLLEPDMRHGMDILAKSYLNYQTISITELIGKKGKNQGNMRDVDLADIAEYAAEDADITFQLKQIFQPLLERNKLISLFENVECPLIHVLAEMEKIGIKIDAQALKDYSSVLELECKEIEKQIYVQSGEEFNIASPKQLGIILFEKLKLDPKAKKTPSGQYATGEEILSKLAYEHEIAKNITDFRELQKLKNTYIDALPLLISPKDGLIHTSYNQAVAATGRLSSTNPNLQNIPIRTDKGREIRKAFIPRNENYLTLSADYSQIELRIMASFSQDESMINAFKNNVDIHTNTASKVFGVSNAEVSSEMRRKAKMVNFGIIYGITPFGLSQRLSISRKEAAEIIDAYFREFSTVKSFMDKMINDGRDNGYVSTLMGRRRYLRDIRSANQTVRGYAERNAINAPIQGSAADMIKVAMINIHKEISSLKLKSKLLLQVHDELVFDVHKEEIEVLKTLTIREMKNAMPLSVPIEVGLGIGENWLEAH